MNEYYSDAPILNKENDLLDRASYAAKLAQSIKRQKDKETTTIGVFGEWGTGKTSFLNMLQDELEATDKTNPKSTKPIIICFEPWNFSNSDQLLNQFFCQLSEKLKQKDNAEAVIEIGTTIEEYSELLGYLSFIPEHSGLGIAAKEIAKYGGRAIKRVGQRRKKNVTQVKEKIVSALEKRHEKIVVFIDDIDRLDDQQIHQVFRLVAAIANFPNMIYVLAFDKEVVSKALDKEYSQKGEEFLQKIIQIPIRLPDISRQNLFTEFVSRWNDLHAQYYQSYYETPEELEYSNTVIRECVFPYLHTLRDAYRLLNTLRVKLIAVGEEVNFTDLTAITTIQIYFPKAFEWIVSHRAFLTGRVPFADPFEEGFGDIHHEKKEFVQVFSGLCGGNKEKAEHLYSILTILFPPFVKEAEGRNTQLTRENIHCARRIANLDIFNIYLDLTLSNVSVSFNEIRRSLETMTAEELKDFFTALINTNGSKYYLEDVSSRIHEIPQSRIPDLFQVFSEHIYRFDSEEDRKCLNLPCSIDAAKIALKLFERLPEEVRKEQFIDFIEGCSLTGFQGITAILYHLEPKNDVRDRAEQIPKEPANLVLLTVEELQEIEQIYLNRLHQEFIGGKHNVLECFNAYQICRMWNLLDSKEYELKMNKLLLEPLNVLRYVCMYTDVYNHLSGGGSIKYRGKDQTFINDAKIRQAIHSTLKDKTFFSVNKRTQISACAYLTIMNPTVEKDMMGCIDMKIAEEVLTKFENLFIKQPWPAESAISSDVQF